MSLDKLKLWFAVHGEEVIWERLSANGRFYELTVRHANGTTSNIAVSVDSLEQNAGRIDELIDVLGEDGQPDARA
jgi:hypothetical protein